MRSAPEQGESLASGIFGAFLGAALSFAGGGGGGASTLIGRIGRNNHTFLNKAIGVINKAAPLIQTVQAARDAAHGAAADSTDPACACPTDKPVFQGGACFSSYDEACSGAGSCGASKCSAVQR